MVAGVTAIWLGVDGVTWMVVCADASPLEDAVTVTDSALMSPKYAYAVIWPGLKLTDVSLPGELTPE